MHIFPMCEYEFGQSYLLPHNIRDMANYMVNEINFSSKETTKHHTNTYITSKSLSNCWSLLYPNIVKYKDLFP